MTIHSVKEFKTADELRKHYKRVLMRLSPSKHPINLVAKPQPLPAPTVSWDVHLHKKKRDWLYLASDELLDRFPLTSIIDAVCLATGVQKMQIMSPSRHERFTHARFIIYWLARRHTLLSTIQVGRRVGDRDHTTVLNGLKKVGSRFNIFEPDIEKALKILRTEPVESGSLR